MKHTIERDEAIAPLAIGRQLIYIIIQTLSIVAMWTLGRIYGAETVSEFGAIEMIQLAVLVVGTILFLSEAFFSPEYRPILIFLSSLCLAAIIRENDSFFDECLPVISWKFCWVFPACALLFLYLCRSGLKSPLFSFLRSGSFYMLLMATVLIIPIAQCVGHRSFIADIMGCSGEDAGLFRRCIEEPLELVGYIQIMLAAIEMHIELLRPAGKRRSKPQCKAFSIRGNRERMSRRQVMRVLNKLKNIR